MSDLIATYSFLTLAAAGNRLQDQDPGQSGHRAGTGRACFGPYCAAGKRRSQFRFPECAAHRPGDVIGINPRVIVRTEPRRWVTDFEPNYLAFIEFYEEDFPWRFTPARAVQVNAAGNPVSSPQQTKLRPWIFLLVLAEGEFEEVSGLSGPLPVIRLAGDDRQGAILPPAAQAWAWAHVHVGQDITCSRSQHAGPGRGCP